MWLTSPESSSGDSKCSALGILDPAQSVKVPEGEGWSLPFGNDQANCQLMCMKQDEA